MKKRYYLSMLGLLPLVWVFDGIYALVLSTTLPFLLLTLWLHLLVFGPLCLLGALVLYRPIERFTLTGEGGEGARVRTDALASRSAGLVFVLGLVYQVAFFALSGFVPQEASSYSIQDIPVALFLTFIPPLLYVSSLLPAFIIFFVIKDFSLAQKLELHTRFGLRFAPGRQKIGRTLAWAFVILGFVPSLLALLSLAGVTMMGAEYAQFTKINPLLAAFPDRFVELVAMVFAVVFITRSFTHPIHALLDKIDGVKEGDYSVQAAVTTGDEIGSLTQEFNVMVAGLRERELIRDTFGRYVNKDIARVILERKDSMEGEVKQATILVTDIANYTTIAEALPPRETVKMLNQYFTDVCRIIQAHQGVVNKFIGDSVFALFNVPIDDADHAVHAVQAALEIEAITKAKLFGDQIRLTTRIGINSGLVLAGNLGSSDRTEYTVIGNEVNVAARLEALNKDYGTGILLGENTRELVKDRFPLRELGSFTLKGKEQSIKVYSV